MDLQLTRSFSRKPLYVEAVQVTAENMEAVTEWCNGDIMNTGYGAAFIQVKVKKVVNPRQSQAFVGDWILLSSTGFKVYLDKAFRGSFEVSLEKPCGDPMTTADGMPCVLGEGHRKMEHPIGCRSLLDYKEMEYRYIQAGLQDPSAHEDLKILASVEKDFYGKPSF